MAIIITAALPSWALANAHRAVGLAAFAERQAFRASAKLNR
ncbi:hypothetical protein ACFXG4_07205 [Nocardia sp. NPDC059246]